MTGGPDDRFWDEVARELQLSMHLEPPTLEEVEAELGMQELPIGDAVIRRIVDAVGAGKKPGRRPLPPSQPPQLDAAEVEEDVFALNRNAGEVDPEMDEKIEKLRREALERKEEDEDEAN